MGNWEEGWGRMRRESRRERKYMFSSSDWEMEERRRERLEEREERKREIEEEDEES